MRLAGFLAKDNLHVAAMGYFIPLICILFCDFKIAQAFGKENAMQTLFFSFDWDKCNDQNLQKVNSVEERISYINHCTIITLAAAIGIFKPIKNGKLIHEIPDENSITSGLGSSIFNIGRHNFLFGKLIKKQNCNLMGCSLRCP